MKTSERLSATSQRSSPAYLLVGLADRLSEGQREAAAGAVQEQREFAINRALGEFGPYILFGGLALAVFALAKR